MVKKFWEVIYYDECKEFEVVGESTDDTEFTNNVCRLRDKGLDVHCNTPSIENSLDRIIDEVTNKLNYQYVKGLYRKLVDAYLR